MATSASLRTTRDITIGILVAQAGVLLILFGADPARLPHYLGFRPGGLGTPAAWGLAALLVSLYVAGARSLPPVAHHLLRFDGLKLLAVAAALLAGITEEVIFRKLVMDALAAQGAGALAQIAASALGFGLVHLVWGLRNWRAAVNAVLSTTLLGAGLAIVYLLAGRSLAPCVVAHGLVSALIEPGLVRAAVEDRIGVWGERRVGPDPT